MRERFCRLRPSCYTTQNQMIRSEIPLIRKRTCYLICLFQIIFFTGVGFSLSDYVTKKKNLATADYLSWQGVLSLEQEDIAKSFEYFYASIYLDPTNRTSRLGLAHIFYHNSLFKLALHEFQEYLSLSENFLSSKHHRIDIGLSYCYVADISSKLGETELSDQYYEKVMEQYPGFDQYLTSQISILEEKNERKPKEEKMLNLYYAFRKGISKGKDGERGTERGTGIRK